MSSATHPALRALCAAWLALAGSAPQERQAAPPSGSYDVAFAVSPGDGRAVAGTDMTIRFTIRDAASGAPLEGFAPAAWVVPRRTPVTDLATCTAMVQTFLANNLMSTAEVDLTASYVVALNDDATISVLDSRLGFGGSQLVALLDLPGPGNDWAVNRDQQRLYVVVPSADALIAVDLMSWSISAGVSVAAGPARIAAEPGGVRLWIASRNVLTVVDGATLEIVATFPIGSGRHDLAFSSDSRYVVITGGTDAGATLLSTVNLERLADVRTAEDPLSVGYSEADGRFWIVHRDGSIVALDPVGRVAAERIQAEPGTSRIAFAPGGRFAFVLNGAARRLYVLDTRENRLVQGASLEDAPVSIAFSERFAYVQAASSGVVSTIPLSAVGDPADELPVITFPAGQPSGGELTDALPAAAIARSSMPGMMFVASASDRTIYRYMEGMMAPGGGIQNDKRVPLAALVVDRRLREREAGAYEAVARLPDPGPRTAVIYLPEPRVLRCFPFDVAADPDAAARRSPSIGITPIPPLGGATVGRPVALRFRVVDPDTGEPLADIADAVVRVMLAPGTWFANVEVTAAGDGFYRGEFVPPSAGAYYAYFGSDSQGITFNNPRYLAIRVSPR